jgi:hypothetical protein
MRITPKKEGLVAVQSFKEMHRALKLVQALHEHPEANAPGYRVKLDPKAEEQVRNAIRRYEYVVLPELKAQFPEEFDGK